MTIPEVIEVTIVENSAVDSIAVEPELKKLRGKDVTLETDQQDNVDEVEVVDGIEDDSDESVDEGHETCDHGMVILPMPSEGEPVNLVHEGTGSTSDSENIETVEEQSAETAGVCDDVVEVQPTEDESAVIEIDGEEADEQETPQYESVTGSDDVTEEPPRDI